MSKVKIKIITIGHLPLNFYPEKISKLNSSIFEIDGHIENYALRCDSDGYNWEFSDDLVKQQLPKESNADYMIAITNVPIEGNWYTRRLGNNQVVFTFHEIKEILQEQNIPLENAVFRLLYAYTLVFLRSNNRIPNYGEVENFTHDETRGCLFDMNGIKTDLVASCHKPIICEDCCERLRRNKVSQSTIDSTKNEIKKIRKDLYYRIFEAVKNHPILTLLLSSTFALIIGVASSVIGSYLFNYMESK